MSKKVTLDPFRAETPLRDLLGYMMTRRISYCQIPYSDLLSVHIAIMFDSEEAAKLSEHLDIVTALSFEKANARKKTDGGG